MTPDSHLHRPLADFLEAMASDAPAPGGGGAAATAVAMASALAVMAARLSTRDLDQADALAERAETLRQRAAPLIDADAQAYEAVLAAYRLPRDDGEERKRRIAEALSHASDVPLEIAEVGREALGVAAQLLEAGNPNLAGDARTAVLLAGAGTQAAAGLAATNLTAGRLEDERAERARVLQREGSELTERIVGNA